MPYIGKTTDGFGVRNRFVYLASSGDTSVSGADANGATLTFTDGAYVDVYLNGVLLKPTTDYNTSTANTIAGLSALNTNDEVTVVVYDIFTVADMVSATSGGTFVGNVTHSGTVTVDDTTDSTSTTTGSIQTDGGVGIAKDLVVGDDILLKSDGAAIQFGADSEITLTHSSDNGLLIKHAASGDDKFPSLVLQTGDTDIAVNDVLGRIDFQAPDEGTGTDAVLRAASIRAISEGDFSASNNATTLEFMTGDTAAPTRRMRISSTGETTITRAGSVTDHGGLLRLNGTYSSTNNGPNIMFHGTATDAHPSMQILNYSHNDISINFDAYYNTSGNWISSDSNGNYQLVKRSDKMYMYRKSGVTAGSGLSWVEMQKAELDNGQTTFTANVNSISHVFNNIHGTTPYGLYVYFESAAPDNNSNYFLRCVDGGDTARLTIYSDGDIYNHDGTYTQISDERIKTNITDAKSQWDDLKAIRFVNYEKKDDVAVYGEGKKKELGVVAQELEKVCPNLVKEYDPDASQIRQTPEFGTLYTSDDEETKPVLYTDSDDIPIDKKVGDVKEEASKKVGEIKEVKSKVKGIKQSILYMKAVKALQEAMERIETLEAKVKTLEEA